LLEFLNNIVNTVNVAAAAHQIENCKSHVACEKIPNIVLLAKSEDLKTKGKNAAVCKSLTQQTNLIVEKMRERKVFK